MKIVRLDSDRKTEKEITHLTLELENGERFMFREKFGELEIMKSGVDADRISIFPGVSNLITIK